MAASRSATAPEAPCIGVPPVMDTFVLGALLLDEAGPGVELREVGFEVDFCLGASRSETREPAADGGGLVVFWGGGVDVFGVAVLEGTLLLEAVDPPPRPMM